MTGMKSLDKNGKIRKKFFWCVFLVILFLQIAWAFYWCLQKEGYYVDEEFTYSLSNSYYEPFLNFTSDYFNTWHDKSYFHNALTVQPGQRMDFASVAYNQGEDVHPPLYYYIIHFLSSLKTDFFSKWIGLAPNLVFFAITLVLTFLLAREVTGDRLKALISCTFFGFSAGAMADVLYIRMYMLLTLWIVLSFLLHVRLIKAIIHKEDKKKAQCMKLLFFTTFAGLMTQYYFLIIQFFLSGVFILILLKEKQIRAFLDYILAQGASVFVYFIAWPKFFEHVLGIGQRGNTYRAMEARENILNYREAGQRIVYFLQKVNREMFGGYGVWIFLGLILVWVVAICYTRRTGQKTERSKEFIYAQAMLWLPTFLYIILVSILVPDFSMVKGCIGTRYFWPVYPLVAVGTVSLIMRGINRVWKAKASVVVVALMACICIIGEFSQENAHDELLYKGYDALKAQMEQENCRAILITNGDYTYMYQLTLLESHPQVACVTAEDFADFFRQNCMRDGKISEKYVIYVGTSYDLTIFRQTMFDMLDEVGVKNREFIGYFGGNIFEVYP